MISSSKLFAVVVFAVSLLLAAYDGGRQFQEGGERIRLGIGSVPLQERGPAVSSPQTRMAPNGDRVSPYPPYFHPEASGTNR